MIRFTMVVAGCLLISGCTAPILAGLGGAGVGWAVTAESDVKIADGILAADKPAKQKICDRELPAYHPIWFQTWCAHLPSDVDGLAEQWALIGIAESQE